MVTREEVTELYVATFNRAPDADGLDYWTSSPDFTIEMIAKTFFDQEEAQALYPEGTTNESFVIDVYKNLFNRLPETDGYNYWVDALDTGLVSRSTAILAFVNGAQGSDDEILANKAEVGLYYADQGGADGDFYLDDIDATEESVENGKAAVDSALGSSVDFSLTAGKDELVGTSGEDAFDAPITQNDWAGGVSNTLSTADNISGGAGSDSLYAELVPEFYGVTGNNTMDVQPDIQSVEYIEFEAMDVSPSANAGATVITVDAKKMTDVDHIGSTYSDGDLVIENLTTLTAAGAIRNTEDITITMDHTDNFDNNGNASDLTVLFDDDYLLSGQTTSDNAYFFLEDREGAAADPDKPLNHINTDGLTFTVDGVSKTISLTAEEMADFQLNDGTWAGYVDLMKAALAEAAETDASLADLTLDLSTTVFRTQGLDGTTLPVRVPAIVLSSSTAVIEATGFHNQEDAPGQYDVFAVVDNTEQSVADLPITVNVELTKVGRDGDGGDLIIGSMVDDGLNTWADNTSEQGIEVFNVTVYGDKTQPSSLDSLRSTNNILKEVNVVSEDRSDDSYADLTIGNGNPDGDQHDGLKDVQTFNAEEFKGDLDITVNLTDEIMDKYLDLGDDASDYTADNVDFVYTGGVGDDSMTFNIDGMPVAHEDFTFAVNSGDGNDTITTQIGFFNDTVFGEGDDTWEYGDHKALDNLSIDTGAGDDVVRTTGDGDFTINTGNGNDTVYTNNDGLLNGDALVQEVQVITFGEAGDLNTQGNVTVTLSNGAAFTVTTILTDDTAATVATKVAAAINAQDAGVNVIASASGNQVELQYSVAYINAQTDTNGDVGMATVDGLVTDVTMNPAVVTTPAVPGTAAADATVETVVITTAGILDGTASDTLTFGDGTVVTLKDTDGNGSVTAFEMAEQIAAATFTDYTVTDSNPSIGIVELTANVAGDVADLTVAVAGVTAPAITITQGTDAVDYAAGTAEVQTLTITNGADQAGIVTMGVDVDADGTIDADEQFDISVGYGNQADVAADIAVGINSLTGVSATHAANSNDVVVTWDSDLLNPAAITMVDGAVRSVSVAEETKGRMASATTATWVLNADNREIDDLSGTDVSADAIIYNSTVTITLTGATFGSSKDDVTNAAEDDVTNPAADAYDNGFEVTATIPTSNYVGNEYDLNQAIKDAIQNDAVMSNLLSVEDGPEDTLIITSLVDGKVLATDLAIDVSGPTSLSTGDLAALNVVYKDMINNSDAADLTEAQMLALINTNLAALDDGYTSPVLATDEGVERAGSTSVSESDNTINLGSGDDLVVLGTDAESNDTIVFTGSDIGTNAIFNFVADGTSGATDYLDFSAYLTNVASVSGSTASEAAIAGDYLFDANALNENDVVFINDFAADAVNGETWANLTADKLLTAIVNTNNTDYASIDSADLDVSNANGNLVGNTIKNIILVENDKNDGEYKVFEATSSASADEFTSINLLGEVDFGEEITRMSTDDGLDNDGGQDDGGVVVPANVTYAGPGADTVIGTTGNDTFVVVGQVAGTDYIAGATNGTNAAYFAAAVDAIENGQAASDISTDYYDGGSGTDTMEIWGNVNFLAATLKNIEVYDIHSTVTFRLDQLEGATVNTQDDSVVRIDADNDGLVDETFSSADGNLDDLQDYIDNGGEVVEPENTPPVVDDQTLTVDENSVAGTVVGTVEASDADLDALTYSLPPAVTEFVIDSETGVVTVAEGAVLDYETTDSYPIEVRVTDPDGAFDTAELTIAINDVVEGGDTTPPILDSVTPADDATDVPVDANLVLNFSEPVQAGTGTIAVFNAGGLVEAVSVENAVFEGNTVTVDLVADLDPSTDYFVRVQPTAIEDLAGNAFAGIAAPTDFNFTTAGGGGGLTELVTGANTDPGYNASVADVTFNFTEATYTYIISGFDAGDVLDFFGDTVASVSLIGTSQTSGTDGMFTLEAAVPGSTVTINFTNVDPADDAQIIGVASFDTVFGDGTIVD